MPITEIPGIFFLAFLLEYWFEIRNIVDYKNTKERKYWYYFLFINLAVFLSIIISFMGLITNMNHGGLNEGFMIVLIFGFIFLVNTITFVVGSVMKRKIENNDRQKKTNSPIIVGVIVFLINMFIVFVLPSIITTIRFNVGKTTVLNYLEDNYADCQFNITKIELDYSYNGLVGEYSSGYSLEVKSNCTSNVFVVDTDKDFKIINEEMIKKTLQKQ